MWSPRVPWRVVVCLGVLAGGGLTPAWAQAPPAPRIFSVVEDPSGALLVISGARFGDAAEVWVDGQPVPVVPGATDERLEVEVPPVWRVQPGTYRLVVRTTQGRTDTFEVTMGGSGSRAAPEAGPEGRPADAGAATLVRPDTSRQAGEQALVAAPGATRPGIEPAVTENPGSPWATAVGYEALYYNTTGLSNTAAGYRALFSNTTGSENTAVGSAALVANTTGVFNTAAGVSALASNTTGFYNTAAGSQALALNTTGSNNTAAGMNALRANTTGSSNTAAGSFTLYANTTGINNTAAGDSALSSNTTGSSNTADGFQALQVNTIGSSSTAAGAYALRSNTTGGGHTAVGYQALAANTTGFNNMAVGNSALYANTTGYANTAAGYQALAANTTGIRNVALGYQAGNAQTTGSNNVYVANAGVDGESGTIRIGTAGTHTDTYLAGLVRAAAFAGDGTGLTGVVATSAASASDLACTGCVSASEVSFGYAGSASGGGPATSALSANTAAIATDLECKGCVEDFEVNFTYAGSASPGGPATSALTATTATSATTAASANNLTCTGCVSASEVSFPYAGSASAGGPATSALTATTAGSALTAATATTAANASALGGQPPSAYASAAHTHPQFGAMVVQGSPEQNTALGTTALGGVTSGTANTALGYGAGSAQTTGSRNLYLANVGVAGENDTIRLGTPGTETRVFLSGARGVKLLLANKALALKIDKFGQLGTTVSSRRYKTDIRDMGRASSGLLRLRPVTFRYKGTDDPSRDYGLIAEEVAEVLPDLVVRNDDGQVETVQYDQLPVLLLNELQKQHRAVEAQAGQLAAQDQQLRAQARQLTGQAAELAALQQRLAHLEALQAGARPGGTLP